MFWQEKATTSRAWVHEMKSSPRNIFSFIQIQDVSCIAGVYLSQNDMVKINLCFSTIASVQSEGSGLPTSTTLPTSFFSSACEKCEVQRFAF
jgi:aspartyl/asparaginyl-tRNA synthetase